MGGLMVGGRGGFLRKKSGHPTSPVGVVVSQSRGAWMMDYSGRHVEYGGSQLLGAANWVSPRGNTLTRHTKPIGPNVNPGHSFLRGGWWDYGIHERVWPGGRSTEYGGHLPTLRIPILGPVSSTSASRCLQCLRTSVLRPPSSGSLCHT